ncbi:MAG: CDC48 family AAA ATPase [Candidatus Hodarchaeota archaeon]
MSRKRVRVMEAFLRDVDRGIIRLPKKLMKDLEIRGGEVVSIFGEKVATAVAWSSSDKEMDIVRMDGTLRSNAGVSLDDFVEIEKTIVGPAKHIVFEKPADLDIEGKEDLLHGSLLSRPVSVGDQIRIGRSEGHHVLTVKSHLPENHSVMIVKETEFEFISAETIGTFSRETEIPGISYEDIGGLEEETKKLREMIELPIRYPKLFERLGIDPPKGVLLYGPPGTGKTLLAKAVARESGATFRYISGPEIMGEHYGESEKRIRDIFRFAKEKAPSIIFFDEIDSIVPHRERDSGELERRIVAQLLSMMDGLGSRGQVVVIGATNRPNAIDPALRRPGRFDREIEIGVPNKKGRRELLEIHTRNMPLADSVDLDRWADNTHGFVGADIAALTREAGLRAARRLFPDTRYDSNEVSDEILASVQVTKDDFDGAFKEIGPSSLREISVETPNVQWDEVGGLWEAKKTLIEAVEWPLKFPSIYEHTKMRSSRGVLLYGPPGTGKTLLVRALASRSKFNFIAIRGPELVSKYVGETERTIREIFRKAKQAAPCICFFDEIDSLVPARSEGKSEGFVDRVVSTFLTILDGTESLGNVILVAATNRFSAIDPALLRPGRFDHLIEIPLPDINAREAILRVHLPKEASDSLDLAKFATKLEGMSGADIEALCREARLIAIRRFLERHGEDLSDQELKEKMKTEGLPIVVEDVTRALKRWDEDFKKKGVKRYLNPE